MNDSVVEYQVEDPFSDARLDNLVQRSKQPVRILENHWGIMGTVCCGIPDNIAMLVIPYVATDATADNPMDFQEHLWHCIGSAQHCAIIADLSTRVSSLERFTPDGMIFEDTRIDHDHDLIIMTYRRSHPSRVGDDHV